MKALLFICLLSTVGMPTCKKKTEDEIARKTILRALLLIKNNDFLNFKAMLPDNELPIATFYFKNANIYLNKYVKQDLDKLQHIVGPTPSALDGSVTIRIPLYFGYDPENCLVDAAIEFGIGPPEFVPLTSLAHFHLDEAFDRRCLEHMDKVGK